MKRKTKPTHLKPYQFKPLRKILIGIDPDVKNVGCAVWNRALRTFEFLGTHNFFELMKFLEPYKETATIVLEAGWGNVKSNYHSSVNNRAAQKIAKNVGENHRAGKMIFEFLEMNNFDFFTLIPKKAKTEPKYFEMYSGRKISNQDVIDAAMLVYNH